MSQTAEVVIYSSALCGYCSGAKTLLTKKGVEYKEIRVDKEPGMRVEMVQRSGRTSVPQVFINGEHVGGFDDLMSLDMEDELDPILGLVANDE